MRCALNLMLFSPRTARMETISRRHSLRLLGKESIWCTEQKDSEDKRVWEAKRGSVYNLGVSRCAHGSIQPR